ncbi:hypothetical protein ABIB62_000472 [Mucilaginibacter sp. UYP25]|uniref:hypothetical protein n=1 Tax=unclassified Mucilaginibacter TaxID=2617802 RepID=UPI003398F4C9
MIQLIFNNRRTSAITITCIICWACAFINLKLFPSYSFGLFIWLPAVLGALSTILYAYKNEVRKISCFKLTLATLLIFCLGLLTFAFEGVICIVMAAPIGMLFAWLGYLIGYEVVRSKTVNPSLIAIFLVISMPIISGFEYLKSKSDTEQLRSVTTRIIIKASPGSVWKNVIQFPQLTPPSELIFKAGIAYPINAKIDGVGVGAIRRCNFSTGSFVEPITVWQEPHLLKFDVDEQPETMKEISLYNLHPNHLHGYFVSKHGQFNIIKLKNGDTLLEGTTWYSNNIKPGIYWNLWCDFIIHKIHERVLDHIKAEAEKAG